MRHIPEYGPCLRSKQCQWPADNSANFQAYTAPHEEAESLYPDSAHTNTMEHIMSFKALCYLMMMSLHFKEWEKLELVWPMLRAHLQLK